MLHFSCVKPGHREQAVRSLSGLLAPTTQFNSSFQSTAMPRGAAQKRSTHSEGLESRWGRLLFALSLFLVLFICSVAFEKMTLCVWNPFRWCRAEEQQHQRSTSRERNRVTISISVAPPMPTFPSPHTVRRQQRSRLARAVSLTDWLMLRVKIKKWLAGYLKLYFNVR